MIYKCGLFIYYCICRYIQYTECVHISLCVREEEKRKGRGGEEEKEGGEKWAQESGETGKKRRPD